MRDAKAHILLVDDRPENLLTLETVLADLGQNLVKANSSAEALRLLLKHDFAVILLDVQMPDMDGFEAATLIRERDRSRYTPIIFLTASDWSEPDVFRGYALGAVDYLFKPFNPEILKSKVAVFVDLFQMRAHISGQAEQLMAINQRLEREIAERTRAEQALRASDERYALVMRGTNDGFWDWNILTNEAYFSPRWKTMLGYGEQELNSTFEEWEGRLHPEDRKHALTSLHAHLEGRTAQFELEHRLIHKDGTYRWILSRGMVLRDEHNRPYRMLGCHTDISERKRAEKALEKAADEIRDLYNQAPCGYHSLDADGTVVAMNETELMWLGYTREEIVGKRAFAELLTDPSAMLFGENFSKFKALGCARDIEYQMVRKDGSLLPVLLSETAIRDAEGNYVSSRSTVFDMTDRKAAEAQIKEHSAELEAVNKELEAFSYSVSHDLRAPLRHIDGFADLLKKQAASQLDEKGVRYLNTISESAKRMGCLIDDLLLFSRVGRDEMCKIPVDTNQLVQEVIANLRPDTEHRNIAWTIASLPPVAADRAMLRQVFANLIGNAVKYTRGREPATIEIGCYGSPEESVIFVRDNGAGFDMRYVHKLFGVFQRLHSAAEFEGTGIGLANVRRIMTRHGGRVWAEGAVGQGATFYVSLPKK
jgi:PAS domain S-box-containing protein